MSTKPKIVAVSGGLYKPSRTRVLVDEIVNGLVHHQPADVRIIDLSAIAAELGAVVTPTDLPRHILDDIHAIEQADLLVVASPVYRASFTGLFKHLFDFVHHEALIDVPVLLAATGGSERHALVIDHQLRPLFSFFQAHTLPIGVYGSEADFHNYRVTSESLQARIDLAVTRALPFLKKRRQPQQDLAAA